LTLIIGLRAHDGVVLASDRKVMRGGEAHFSNKIHSLNEILFATEGLTGIADDFLLLLRHEASLKKGFGSLYEARILAEDVISELTVRYSGRLSTNSTVGLLMAGLEELTTGPAKLYYIHSEGYGESVSFRCSGSGADYATTLAKFFHDETESVEENARRAAFVIHWVSQKVDTNVGGTPQVAMIRDQDNTVNWLPDTEIEAQRVKVEAAQSELWTRLTTPSS
jgi:20S proteasome alpha/beta subunit